MKIHVQNKVLVRALLPLLVFLLHSYLSFNHVLGKDEGVALYTGRVILEGGVPYLDSWDHKGPILYFLNAVGLWISQNAIWGPGLFEGLLLASAVSLLVHQLKQFWSTLVLYSVIIAFLISYYFFMESLNLTESWTLGFQMIAYLLIFIESNKSRNFDSGKVKNGRLFFTLGLAFSIIFYTRPNNSIGVLLATITFSFVFARSFALKGLVVFFLTFFSFSTLIFIYLQATHSFTEFVEQFVIYNLDYSSVGSTTNRLDASLHSLFRLAQTPLIIFMVITFIFILLDKSSWLVALGKAKINIAIIVGLLGDFLFSFLSSRGYLHYMIIILPSLMINVGIFQSMFSERSLTYRRVISFALGLCIVFGGIFGMQKAISRFYSNPGNLVGVAKFLDLNSVDTDRVQMLGSETRVLVIAERKSSSSITYSHPATSIFYRNVEQAVRKLENDVKAENPKYIVRNTKESCELDLKSCRVRNSEYREENLFSLYSWILLNYEMVKIIGDYEIWESKKV